MKEFVDDNIERAMRSLDGIKRAKAPECVTNNILSSVKSVNSVWGRVASIISKPLVAAACIVIIVALNLAIIFSSEKNEAKTYYATEDARPVYDIYEIETLVP